MSRLLLVGCTICYAISVASCGNIGIPATNRSTETTSQQKATAVEKNKKPTSTFKRTEKPKTQSPETPEAPAPRQKPKKPTASSPTARERWITAGCPSLNLANLKTGDLGCMPVGIIRYESCGPREAPGQPDLWRSGWIQKRPTGWKVLQVIDEENALLTHIGGFYEKQVNGETFWFEVGTSQMVDGRQYTYDGLWECKGTRRYPTALGGSRTVLVLHYCGESTQKAAVPEDPMAEGKRWLAYWMGSWTADDVKPNYLKQSEWDEHLKNWKEILNETLTGAAFAVGPDGHDETFTGRLRRNKKYLQLFKSSKATKQQFVNRENRLVMSLFCHLVAKSNEDLERVDDKITDWMNLLLHRIKRSN